MSAPDKICELVERFERNVDSYTKGKYNETQTRREFIDPLFTELGWDVDNKDGYAEAYKDVVHEDAIKVGAKMKAPDYSFRIGGVRKFFLEAKKPSVNIRDDISPAYQLRRYAWSAKLPLSVLTDFEEFSVYDCRFRPFHNDKASKSRILYYTYQDYLKKWDEIYDVFSKESILKGSFDKFATSAKGKKGTAEVDAEFLKDIEKWRDFLARNLALRNSQLSQRELNFAVQKTIDRIIFLRICEDRGIELYGRLGALQNGANVYERLLEYFRGADAKYNSGLFHFAEEKGRTGEKDTLTPNLKIDDKVFKEIVKNLYYPECPYEFSVLSADILGQVYEQFLGKVIHLTKGHQAKVEEKPEVRKAGGVYYTPKYIVDYIVDNTVGELLEKSTPKKAEKLKILDPACGSGSFLIGAYQYLLDWYCKQYLTDVTKYSKGRNPKIRQTSKGGSSEWRLTIDERKRILLNNIYGVDIDAAAVEVTKLSLLLKVLEDENDETLNNQLTFSFGRERVLPDLCNNIKCGNSLIGPDFYDGKDQPDLFDEDAVLRVNAFDWDAEFAEIMQSGGFDAIIGNPPYGATLTQGVIKCLQDKYVTAEYQVDTYPIFIEQSISLTQSPKGLVGMIIPSAWVASKYNKGLRNIIASKTTIKNIVIAPQKTFIDATVETLLLFLNNSSPTKNSSFNVDRWDTVNLQHYTHPQNEINKEQNYVFPVYSNPNILNICKKIKQESELLEKNAKAVWGVKVYQKGKGKPPQNGEESKSKIYHSSKKHTSAHLPLLGGRNIQRYLLDWPKNTYINYGPWLAEPRTPEWFSGSRILVREVTSNGIIQATLVKEPFVFSNSVDGLKLTTNKYSENYILALLNSKLIAFYHRYSSANSFKNAFPKLLIKDLLGIPIRTIDFSNPEEKAMHDQVVSLVNRLLDLNKKLPEATVPQIKTTIQRQIDSTDKQIDAIVYKLYDLNEEEIKIVEE